MKLPKFILSVLFGMAAIALAARPAWAAAGFFNGFETNTDGWVDYAGGVITRVASGFGGIASRTGDFHAVVDGPVFTRWGGYNSVFPEFGYVTELDIYLDTALATGVDQRFDFSSAINGPDGNHRRDFIFNVGAKPGVPGEWAVSASNNAPGWPMNTGRSPSTINQTGWYTFRHTFLNNAGVLAVRMEVLDSAGVVVGTWVLSDPSDVIGTTVGGNRYGWFTEQRFDFASLAIDNSRKYDLLPNKAAVLDESGVEGKGVLSAPGLQKTYNPKSQATEHAGKK